MDPDQPYVLRGDTLVPVAKESVPKDAPIQLSSAWTLEERVALVSALLPLIQDDIYAGCYSKIGRPNITSIQHILHESPEVLNNAWTSMGVQLAVLGIEFVYKI